MQILSIFALLAIPCLAKPVPGDSHPLRPRQNAYRVDPVRAEAVKEAFQFAWNGYHKYAFPADELHPISNTPGNSRNGWGASAVDALSTAIIMELPDIVKTIVDYIPTINYTYTDQPVSLFETTIRYLGGMLAGYDLLDGPFSHLLSNSSAIEPLLAQSKRLADVLSFAFNTTSGVPDNTLNIWPNKTRAGGDSTGLAVAGTLVMEWTRLADLTGDPFYGYLAQHAENYLLRPQYEAPLTEPFPGLEGTMIDLTSGKFTDVKGGWVGGDDSFYEYLIKMYVYDAVRFGEYRDRWMAAADSTIQNLGSHPSTRPDLTLLAGYSGTTLIYESEHLACFTGGNFLLGGLVLGEQKYIDFGLALTAGCHATYISDATGIGPEVFQWLPAQCAANGTRWNSTAYQSQVARPAQVSPYVPNRRVYDPEAAHSPYRTATDYPTPVMAALNHQTTDPTADATAAASDTAPTPTPNACALPAGQEDQAAFYQKNGFYITDSNYDLRPEVLESYYYAYRVTGDPKYQEWAWDAFVHINKTARPPGGSGFSAFRDVNDPTGGGYGDNQESFLFAEVMKYAYLIFSEDGEWQVNYRGNGRDKFVFNTEAHPFRVVRPPW